MAPTPPTTQPPTPQAPPPELTKLEKTELENYQLKNALVQQQQQQLQAQYADFMKEVETNHPGFRLIDGPQGASLVPKGENVPSQRPPHSVTKPQ